jgi:hypothetical protein
MTVKKARKIGAVTSAHFPSLDRREQGFPNCGGLTGLNAMFFSPAGLRHTRREQAEGRKNRCRLETHLVKMYQFFIDLF